MTLLGEKGLTALAAENHRLACLAADRLAKVSSVSVLNDTFFNEFTVVLDRETRPVVRDLAQRGVLAGVSLGRLFPNSDKLESGLLITVTETNTEDDIEALATALERALASEEMA